jgi:hypothetical protein
MNISHAVLGVLGAMMMVACAPVDASPQPGGGPVSITLTRSVCFGFCPDYTVTITGEGAVSYVGRRFVNVVGEQHATVPREEVQALLRRFDAVNFEALNDSYRAPVTDIPTYTLSLERNGRRKTVVDYGGVSAGMPREVRALEDEIDRVAQTSRWILRDGQPVRTPQPER